MATLEYSINGVNGGVITMALNNGAHLYSLTADAGSGPVPTVHIGPDENQELLRDLAAAVDAMDGGLSYVGWVRTMLGVTHVSQPNGLIRTVLEPAGWHTVQFIVDDGSGGHAWVFLDRAGADQMRLTAEHILN